MKSLKSASLAKRMANVPLQWPPKNLCEQPEMFERKVIFDLHGPILDWSKAFAAFASELFGVEVSAQDARYYCMGYDASIALTPKQFDEAFTNFARLARGGYGDLEVTPGIKETFARISEAGIKTEIWTWCPGATDHSRETLISYGTGIAQSQTYELIKSLGIVEDVTRQVKFIHPGEKASKMASKHIPLIVEDNPATAIEAGMNFGHAAILVPVDYNKHLSCAGVLRLEKHDELATAIIDFFQKLEDAGALLGTSPKPAVTTRVRRKR